MKFKDISIKWKLLLPTIAGPLVIAVVLGMQWTNQVQKDAVETVIDKSRAIVLMAEATRNEMSKKLALGIIKPFDQIPADKVIEAVPVVTAMQAAAENAAKAHYKFRVPKVSPRNPKNEPTSFEREILNEIKDKDLEEKVVITEDEVFYFKPIRLTEECLFCHGDPAGKIDPTGGRLEGWKAGEIHGAFEISSSLDEAKATVKAATLTVVSWITGILTACILATWLLLKASIIGPLKYSSSAIKKIAGKDLRREYGHETSKDEFGVIDQDLLDMQHELQRVIKSISETADVLETQSNELSTSAENLTRSSLQTSNSSVSVAAAAEQMSANMNNVAAATEQASTNIGIVSQTTDNMARTITEIAKKTENAKRITANAVNEAVSASTKVDELGTAASRIGRVTETITEISEQTNLLALNATIEAARAGDAGKGFAVVANEIKDLARQTATATAEIKNRIEGIQTSTSETISQIEQITTVINEVNDIVSGIVDAMDTQNKATAEIAENINQATLGIQEVTENVGQSSNASAAVAKEITDVSNNSNDITEKSEKMAVNASKLRSLASDLRKMVGEFKL